MYYLGQINVHERSLLWSVWVYFSYRVFFLQIFSLEDEFVLKITKMKIQDKGEEKVLFYLMALKVFGALHSTFNSGFVWSFVLSDVLIHNFCSCCFLYTIGVCCITKDTRDTNDHHSLLDGGLVDRFILVTLLCFVTFLCCKLLNFTGLFSTFGHPLMRVIIFFSLIPWGLRCCFSLFVEFCYCGILSVTPKAVILSCPLCWVLLPWDLVC